MSTQNSGPAIDHSDVAESINSAVNYTMYAVFRRRDFEQRGTREALDSVFADIAALAARESLVVRGWYDVSGFRADADVLLWAHAPESASLQRLYRVVRSRLSQTLAPVWSAIGVHRAAEFNRSHVPAFLAGEEPREYVCVYPFVRGREWYLLPDGERSRLLREHGLAAREFGDVLANTVAAFGLGDYEWLLAFESDELVRIVDLMRELRATEARRHVIEETPFFAGPRVDPTTLFG